MKEVSNNSGNNQPASGCDCQGEGQVIIIMCMLTDYWLFVVCWSYFCFLPLLIVLRKCKESSRYTMCTHLCVQFSSVQFKMESMRSEKPIILRFTPSLGSFPQHCLWNGSNVHLTDDGPLSSFQGRLSSASSFHASLFQAIEGMMSLALCPQVVSQASQHFRSSEKQATCEGCMLCPPVYLLKLWTCNCFILACFDLNIVSK